MFRITTLLALLILCAASSAAQVPEFISHQGKLLDNAGEPVPDAIYTMEFRFYDACDGGNLLLTDSHDVATSNGIYTVLLGGGNLTPGLESGLLEVFKNHAEVCLGTKVGSDSEMQPRQPIASTGFALRAATVDGLDEITARIGNGVYFCDADWNENGTNGESDDVIACIQGALGDLTTNEDGQDNAITVKLPSGRFDVSSACSAGTCFELKSGISIVGEMPRVAYVATQAPDLVMQPNGGTWLDPGPSNTLFTGQHLRGIAMERFGVVNFGQIARIGGDGEDGISFSTVRDVYGIGTGRTANPRSTTAWELYNIQHLRMDHVKIYNVERGLYVIGQNAYWQPANSVITDFYVYTYPNPVAGIQLEVRKPTVGNAMPMNYLTFVRPQVNSFNSTDLPGTSGIYLKGYDLSNPVQLTWFVAADIEGETDVALRMEQAAHNHIEIAGISGATPGISIDSGSLFNTIISALDRVSLDVASQSENIFFGHFDAVDESVMRGLFWDRLANRWSLAIGDAGRINSGDGFLWYDDPNDRWRVKDGVPSSRSDGDPIVTGSGAGASYGPMFWADTGTTCDEACASAGMDECVDGWDAGTSVGCVAGINRRICACR